MGPQQTGNSDVVVDISHPDVACGAEKKDTARRAYEIYESRGRPSLQPSAGYEYISIPVSIFTSGSAEANRAIATVAALGSWADESDSSDVPSAASGRFHGRRRTSSG